MWMNMGFVDLTWGLLWNMGFVVDHGVCGGTWGLWWTMGFVDEHGFVVENGVCG